MTYNKLDIVWDEIVLYGIATEEELQLVTTIDGYNEEVLNDVIYARTGYQNIRQYEEGESPWIRIFTEEEEA